jgi:hypothetical protein
MPVSTISQAGLDAPISLTSPTLTTPNINSAQIATVSGTAPLYMCRAWVTFNGQGTVAIQANGNVSSITDNGVGDYTVNFTTAMSDANYNIQSTCREFVGLAQWISVSNGTAPTTSSCRFRSCDANGTVQDPLAAYIAVFR